MRHLLFNEVGIQISQMGEIGQDHSVLQGQPVCSFVEAKNGRGDDIIPPIADFIDDQMCLFLTFKIFVSGKNRKDQGYWKAKQGFLLALEE